MEKVRKTRLVGWMVVLTLMVGAAWYFSQDETLACDPPVPLGASKTSLNFYRTSLVNGAAGSAWFFQVMPDSYQSCWEGALKWVWNMNDDFLVGGKTYHKWPNMQGEATDIVMTRPQAGIGISFIDAYDLSSENSYRTCAKHAANYLMLDAEDYEVLQDTSYAPFGTQYYWQLNDASGSPTGPVIYYIGGGVPAIGIFFIKMYNQVNDAALDTTYYRIARGAAQYMKEVAIDSTGTGPTDPVWAKWKENSDVSAECYTNICRGTPGVIMFLDSMYVAAHDSGDSDSLTDLRFARAGLQWLMNEAQDNVVGNDTLYWWYQLPDNALDNSYSPMWGRGAAGIGETFLLGYNDLAHSSGDSTTYWHYAEGAGKWVHSKGEVNSGGLRWRYMYDDPGQTDTLYYTYFCRGQGPVIRFFTRMYDQAKECGDSDSSLYLACADSGRTYLDSTKVEGYQGGACWDGVDVVSDEPDPDNDYTFISVSWENGPSGLGMAMFDASKYIGNATRADSADSVKFMDLAFDCANWMKAELHVDTVLGGHKWSWRAAEDSITVKLRSSQKDDTLDSDDTFVCTLWVYNWKNSALDSVFWWVDYLRSWDNKFTFVGGGQNPDSGTFFNIPANDSVSEEISHSVGNFNNLPAEPESVGVNCSASFWLNKIDKTKNYTLDQDCFRIWVKE
jgi:hypothetical protein